MSARNPHSKVGSTSVTTVNFNSWVSTPVAAVTEKTRKTRVKEIIHPIFTDCAKVTSDPFWVEKFNLAAIGKFPTNFTYHDGTLTYKKGAKTNKVVLSNNIKESAKAFMDFLRTNKSIFSPLDEQTAELNQSNRVASAPAEEYLTWETSGSKIKECLISYYIIDMTRLMNLNTTQANQLRKTINTGIFSNVLDKNNIKLENNRINSIGGLLYDPHNAIFYIDPSLVPTIKSATKKKPTNNIPKDSIPQFNLKWEKYINKYIEQIDKQYVAIVVSDDEDYEE
jgi:hypothetical protein